MPLMENPLERDRDGAGATEREGADGVDRTAPRDVGVGRGVDTRGAGVERTGFARGVLVARGATRFCRTGPCDRGIGAAGRDTEEARDALGCRKMVD